MKTLAATSLALCLGLTGMSASAALLNFSVHQSDPDGYFADFFTGEATPFEDEHLFTLSGTTKLSGHFSTVNLDDVPGLLPHLDVQAAYFQAVSGGPVFNLVETLSANPQLGGVETWDLSDLSLGAGQWKLVIKGFARNNKGTDGYEGEFTGTPNDVPEPTVPALLGAAFAALAWSRRSQASTKQ